MTAMHTTRAGANRLQDETWDLLCEAGARVRYKKGQEIFQEGETGDSLFLVTSGLVRIVLYSAGGKGSIVSFLGPREIIGEVGCITGAPRTATVECAENVEGHLVSQAELFRVLGRSEAAVRDLLTMLCHRLRRTDGAFQRVSALSMKGRLAGALLALAEQYGEDHGDGTLVRLAVTQSDIGAFSGLSRENTSRILSGWRKAGLIAFAPDKRSIILNDPDALAEIADFDW
ncbi:MAG: Crp/Fnr family transcriptional regulator [Pseudomonadota bacterium]